MGREISERRQKAKANRGKGQKAMAGVEEAQWAQRHDPLFQVKGLERHLRVRGLK